MSETLEKLRPDRDLQCYFFRPSAIAAFSGASSSGFTLSGTWRQQFDWAVVEWNRDNVFEHPVLRNLPDGDLSGLTLSYRETRTNCIPLDSGLFPTVDWPYLRIWAEDSNGDEQLQFVKLADYATPTLGSYTAAAATFTLLGTLTVADVVELSWLNEHYFHTIQTGDTIADVLAALANDINLNATTVSAVSSAPAGTITLQNTDPGEEGNNLGIVTSVSGAQTEQWSPTSQTMSGGTSPTQWQIDLDFGNLQDRDQNLVPTQKVRKMRWTYAAAQQPSSFSRSEFDVVVSSWTVTGTNRSYKVAGLGSRRQENDSNSATYSGTWTESAGNFSSGTIQLTTEIGASVTVTSGSQLTHRLFLGTRRTDKGGIISVSVDGGPAQQFDLFVLDEDFLVRLDLGSFGAGSHTVEATLTGANPASQGSAFYFDYVEAAVEATTVDSQAARPNETLATDWDTDHSLALAPERVAWNLQMLGFTGRANHYVGAILFYELTNPGNVYSEGTVTFSGTPVFSETVQVVIDGTPFSRLTLSTDTNETITKAFEFLINNGTTGVWASSSSNVLTIHARMLGTAGNQVSLSASPTSGTFQATTSGSFLNGGVDSPSDSNAAQDPWITEVSAVPRMNRAARDWHRAYFVALKSHGIDGTAAFSTELSHGDMSVSAGIAQRYPNSTPPDSTAVVLSTPAIQTNFSPTSIDFWKQVYLEMAQMQDEAQVTPYLQFGEVQWWYFPNGFGMTFYDDYSTVEFQTQHSRPMHVFTSNDDSLDPYPEEASFLPGLIANYTVAIRDFVRATYPSTKFEVLYPHDVNDFSLTRVVNYPDTDWIPVNLEILKTENFGYTAERNLNKALESIRLPQEKGFPRNQGAHLVGVFSAAEPWNWERRLAQSQGVESVVLWAFDQFSMIGYRLPLYPGIRRGRFLP